MPIEILSYEETPLGVLCLRRRELLSKPGTLVTEVTLNHEFLMSSYLTDSERALARIGMAMLTERKQDDGTELSVLVGGLGLGYTAVEALRSSQTRKVDVIEFLPSVIGWLNDGLIPLANELTEDRRLAVREGDIYSHLTQRATEKYDLIAIDVDHSPEDVLGTQSNGFYTVDGLQVAKTHLSPGGILGLWSYDANTPLKTNMESVFENVVVEKVTVWNDLINIEQTDWLYFGRRSTGESD